MLKATRFAGIAILLLGSAISPRTVVIRGNEPPNRAAPAAAAQGQGKSDDRPSGTENQYDRLDENYDGFLTLAEFVKPHPRDQWSTMGGTFYRFDRDRDGRLSREEFEHVGDATRMRPDPVAVRVETLLGEIDPVFAGADAEGEGRWRTNEWPDAKIASAAPELSTIPFAEWDRDGDGAVTAAERRLLVEIAWGVRRPDGLPLRRPSAIVFNWGFVRMIDANRDDFLSRAEFVAGYFEGGGNAARFKEADQDNDGRLSFAELLGIWPLYPNPQIDFCRFDADLDGRASRDELIAGAAPWQKKMAPRLAAAFDLDGDGGLSLEEYQLSPFGNPLADWYGPRYDVNNDGQLSWQEFYAEKSPALHGMSRHFFIRFDRDGDGYLSPGEFDFKLDFAKAPAPAAFTALDEDHDGQIVLTELVELVRPQSPDPAVLVQWEEKVMRSEEAFRAADANGDGSLAFEEFTDGRAALAAAIAGSAPRSAAVRVANPDTTTDSPSVHWRLIGLIAGNIALLAGLLWVKIRRRRPGREIP